MEHEAFLSPWCSTFMYTRENDVLFLNALRISLAPTPQEGSFRVMFVGTDHSQEQKEQKVCDWNHLSLSVGGPAVPASKRGRGLDLTQHHFAAQTKTFEREGQNATQITSVLYRLVHSISFAGDVDLDENIVSVSGSHEPFA